MDAVSLLDNLTRRGIRLTANPPKLIAEPSTLLTDADREAIRAHKPDLLALLATPPPPDPATDARAQAVALLHRLRAYTLPAGRMPAARAIVELLRPLLLAAPALDPAQALAALQAAEAELIGLGGRYDPELAAAIGIARALDPNAKPVCTEPIQ